MTPPDLARVHPVILARLREVLARLANPTRDPAADRAELAHLVTLERWSVGQDRWGLLRLDGMLVADDGYEFRFRLTPVVVDRVMRRVWASHGWMGLGAHAELPDGEALATLFADLESWCAALQEGLRHG